VDDLLLAHAYARRKPVLGICYGLQSLNVFRGGSLIQHIPDFLPPATRGKVNHEAGKIVPIAHSVEIDPNSKLAQSIGKRNGHDLSRAAKNEESSATEGDEIVIPVNSSHHQSAEAIGSGLRIVARCTADGIIEAVEGTAPDHFVIAVQWHPERSVRDDEASLAIFRALIQAAAASKS
jgi:putative glutamine amidotransferase